jgi:CheY-like chemotaxis protein
MEVLSNSSLNNPFGNQMDWWIESLGESTSLPPTPTSAGGSVAPKSATQGRVLAVDDNADMLAYVTRILTEGGYSVMTARDGLDALTKIREVVKSETSSMFDIIVSDVMMPRLDGRGLLSAIRKSEAPIKDIPVVFLSARAGEEEIGEGVALGADDYLVKPFSARELLTRVSARIELTRFRLSAAKREQVLREAAERANKAKDHFIAVLSHELRTPLTPALMIAEAGESDATLTEAHRQDMATIASNIRLEVQLISDLLDITKISYVACHVHE